MKRKLWFFTLGNFFISLCVCCLWQNLAFASAMEERFLDSASEDLIYEHNPSATEEPMEGESVKGEGITISSDRDSSLKLSTEKKSKPFNFSLGFQQISGFIESADRVTQGFLTGTYRFKESWSLSASQTLNRHYFLNPNSHDKGLWIQDTIFSLNKKFTPYKTRLRVGLSSTLPLSYYSNVNDIFTVSTLYLNWGVKLDPYLNLKSAWFKNLTLFVKPVGRYYLSRYTTSRTEGQSLGGTPLPQFLAGVQSMGLSFSVTDRFSFNGAYGRWVIYPYKTQYARDENSQYDEYYLRHYYLFSFATSWRITKQWSLSLSYSHVDRLDRQGRAEIVFFDDQVSSWSLSTSYSFSFDFS